MDHPAIARMLFSKYKVPIWWSQMVTVTYEQARRERKVNQRPDGYEFTISRTYTLPLAKVFRSWKAGLPRLKKGIVIRKSTPNKTIRATWIDGKKSIAIGFSSPRPGKTQVALQHGKLKNEKEVAKLKAFWKTIFIKLS